MIKCPDCNEEKPESAFGRNARRENGLMLYCRTCTAVRAAAYRVKTGLKKPVGWTRKTGDMQEYRRAWNDAHPGYGVVSKRRWLLKNPERAAAKEKTWTAIRYGKLKKLPCAECGNADVQAHHPDYSKPLEVVWLCVDHHHEIHRELRRNRLTENAVVK